jgi:hypothetical protein
VRRATIILALAGLTVACNPKSLKPGYCHTTSDCKLGETCNAAKKCEATMDGSMDHSDATSDHPDAMDAGDGGDASDASDAADTPPPTCTTNEALCTDGGYDGSPGVCEREAGVCVECLADGDCARKPTAPICEVAAHVCVECLADGDCARKPTAPICEVAAHVCRACKTDAECPDPKVCMMDGHCVTSDEAVFVEAGSTACLPPDGGTTNTYCTLSEGVSHLDASMGRTTLIVRGPINGPLTISGVPGSILVVGKPNTAGAAQIGAGVGTTGITISGSGVTIRDLTVFNGGSATSKGIVATGSTTTLKLLSVQVNLGMGLGIQADTGAQLTMDRCTVMGNNKGGILLDAATFDIENTTVTNNGPSADLTWGGIRVQNLTAAGDGYLKLVTIQGNNPSGVSCEGPISGDGVLATSNVSGDISQTCGFMSCGTVMTATCGAPQ